MSKTRTLFLAIGPGGPHSGEIYTAESIRDFMPNMDEGNLESDYTICNEDALHYFGALEPGLYLLDITVTRAQGAIGAAYKRFLKDRVTIIDGTEDE